MKLSTIVCAVFLTAAASTPALATKWHGSTGGHGSSGGTPAAVPEPASMLLLGGGAAALAFARKRRAK